LISLAFDFYPGADGVLIESSDYAICHCADCAGRFYEREFAFVESLSAELWKARPDATIVVYPHYFSGAKVPGMDADAARRAFDPRWALFFTPHSAHPAELVGGFAVLLAGLEVGMLDRVLVDAVVPEGREAQQHLDPAGLGVADQVGGEIGADVSCASL